MFDNRMLNSEVFKQKLEAKTKEVISRYCGVDTTEIPAKEVQNCIVENTNCLEVLSEVVKAVCILSKKEMRER